MLGEQLKTEGMALAADNNINRLEDARLIATEIASSVSDRRVTADDVAHVYFLRHGRCMAKDLGPAAGSLFKTRNFRFTGERVRSCRAKNHARELKVWEYINGLGEVS